MTVTFPIRSTDQVLRGLNRLLGQFDNSPKLRALLATYLRQLQTLETFAWSVIDTLSLTDGFGITLDRFGKLVGRGRGSLSDADFLVALRAQIRINRSRGMVVDFLDVASISVNDPTITFRLRRYDVKAVQIVMQDAAVFPHTAIFALWTNLKLTKSAATKLFFTWPPSGDVAAFRYAAGPVASSARVTHVPALGYAWTDGTGGHYQAPYSA
jgi:hypothetical protein